MCFYAGEKGRKDNNEKINKKILTNDCVTCSLQFPAAAANIQQH